MTAYSQIAVDIDGPVGTITLNRPDKLNAFTVDMVQELKDALAMLARTTAVRAIVLTGAGRAFCAGADVGLLRQLIEHFDDKVFRTIIPRNVRLAEAPSHGRPALYHDKESRGALAYLALAGEMIRREEEPAAAGGLEDEPESDE